MRELRDESPLGVCAPDTGTNVITHWVQVLTVKYAPPMTGGLTDLCTGSESWSAGPWNRKGRGFCLSCGREVRRLEVGVGLRGFGCGSSKPWSFPGEIRSWLRIHGARRNQGKWQSRQLVGGGFNKQGNLTNDDARGCRNVRRFPHLPPESSEFVEGP